MATRSKDTDIEIRDTETAVDNNIIDIEFKELQKKRFRLDRDNNRVIELNTSDLTIVKRLEEVYPKLINFVNEAQQNITAAPEEDADTVMVEQLMVIDKKMRDLIDYLFDSKVADKAAPNGSMYDLYNGKFTFEYVIEKLIGLYDTNFNREYEMLKSNVSKHTSKYTKKRK